MTAISKLVEELCKEVRDISERCLLASAQSEEDLKGFVLRDGDPRRKGAEVLYDGRNRKAIMLRSPE